MALYLWKRADVNKIGPSTAGHTNKTHCIIMDKILLKRVSIVNNERAVCFVIVTKCSAKQY